MVEPGIKGAEDTVNEILQSTSAGGGTSNDNNTNSKPTSCNISKSSPAGVSLPILSKMDEIRISIVSSFMCII